MSGTKTTTTPATSSKFCSVACKLPHGIILELEKKIEGGAFLGTGRTIELKGANDPKALFGFGITENVPVDLFDEIMKQKENFLPIANGLIFKQPTTDKLEDEAKEREGLKTGTEPMDPEKPAPGVAPATKD